MNRRNIEQGQAAIMFSMLAVFLILMVGLVVDVGFLIMEKRQTQNALDAAALAGAQELPGDVTAAEKAASDYALANGLDADEFDISFECTSKLLQICNPVLGKYDTIVLKGTSQAPAFFGGVLGLVGDPDCWEDGCHVSALAAACSGGCGASLAKVDLVAVIDHTGSMESTELQNAKDGAATMFKAFDTQIHNVALAVTPPVMPTDHCETAKEWTDPLTWLPVGLNNVYQSSPGVLDGFSPLAATTNCLDLAGGSDDVPGPHTNLGAPMKAAMDELLNNGRPDATKGIVLLTDGAANIMQDAWASSTGALDPCDYAMKMADAAKANGIEIYTIAYGAEDRCDRDDPSSPWYDDPATDLLAAMATDAEHYFEQPRTSDLDPVFETIGLKLGGSTRLIR